VIQDKVIVSGIVNRGIIRSGSKYHLGPYNNGCFKIVEILNIHCKKIPVKSVRKGQYCSIWIKSAVEKIKREDLRKGMVLLDMQIKPVATKIFEADIWTIDGTRKMLKSKYQPVLNIKHIRQGCRIVEFKHKHGNTNKSSSSINLISYGNNTKKNKNLIAINNNNCNNGNDNDKNSQEKNKTEINSNSINNFVEGNHSDLNPNSSPNNSEIRITNIHPLRNLPNRSDLKGSFDKNFNNQINIENNNNKLGVKCLENNLNKIKKENSEIRELNIISTENNNRNETNSESALLNTINPNNTYKRQKKNSINNDRKKTDYNSNNAISNINNSNENQNQQNANKAIKQQHKKSSISKTEELELKIKTDFKSDKKIIKINKLNSEYDSLKSNENEYNEETCVISPNNNCTVVFEFMYYPEYITEDANILISDQLIKAHGIVRKLLV
jgi:hypothetical protein